MVKACEAYVTIVLTKGFNITVYKKASVCFIVTYSHEIHDEANKKRRLFSNI